MTTRVLLIDNETDFLEVLSERLRARGLIVETTDSPRKALIHPNLDSFDVAILDFAMPELDGLAVLSELVGSSPELQVILLTGHATVEMTVKAIKLGALDVLEKPPDMKALNRTIEEAKEQKRLLVEKRREEEIRRITASKPW